MIRRQANGFVMLEMASKERGLPGLGDRTLREEGGMILCGYAVGGGGAESGREMMADEEEEVKKILQKLQVGQRVKTYM